MIFTIIAPIFLLLALGYLSVKFNFLNKNQCTSVGTFVITIALPALFLQSLAAKKLDEFWFPEYIAVYGGITFFIYFIAFLVLTKLFKNSKTDTAVLSLGAAMSNTGLIGTAVLTLLFGHEATMTYTSMIVIFESVCLIPLVLILAEFYAKKDQGVQLAALIKNTLLTLFKNPLFMGVMLGLGLSLFQIKIPQHLDQVLLMLGQTASPLALFTIGGGIVGLSLKYVNIQSFYLVISNNILMPLSVYFGLLYLTNLSLDMVRAATLVAALPMPTIFAILGQSYGLSEKTLTPLLMSNIVGFSVMSFLIAIWWT